MIRRVLVANRAEIASRVFRTCRRLGIETVAVHSDADAELPYVREADYAVALRGTAPADTYLRADLLIEAAVKAGADAVHPGYGFLSENADFARAVLHAGLAWIGPTPESIEAMGSKIEAKRIMREAGVPVLEAPAVPAEADLPLLVKASAGGGGRGMRVVRRLGDLDAEVAAARAEALSAFGDETVFIEPYVEHGRHVEVQVWGDWHGNISVLGERDCSIQRRHQKVVEESPAPHLPLETREALHAAARAAAEAIDYRGAGTVEFLYDAGTGRFWFLEMNTRLQVEHPVTELVSGLDLVELQLRTVEDHDATGIVVEPHGHAIEARVYAEDPAADHQPQSGVLTRFDIPVGDGVRVDSGYESGSTVSTFYDAMLAKVICHGATRGQAARKLADTLARARIHGLRTNRDQLVEVLRSEAFLSGDVSTAFLDGPLVEEGALAPVSKPSAHAVAAAIALAEQAGAARTVQAGIPVGWRNVPSQPHRTELVPTGPTGEPMVVEWSFGPDGYRLGWTEPDETSVVSTSSTDGGWGVTLETDSVRTTYDVTIAGNIVDVDGPTGHLRLARRPRFTDPADAVASGSLLAPMPGTVVRVAIGQGDHVTAGQPVLVLEAMKMQHTVTAPHDGVVARIDVRAGQQVAAGEVLAVVAPPGA
ncbi:HlyD family efflux transporter periplasmic adaptor subunit [Nocardioides agariphilus]|uniref:HlyD family efflux transporter periplasmic adaptor subunit n=1 Tax=Nocardioides agariphilus TaxID=433664 RepID=A0A930VJA0_9ACTN|nr:HlyD family efflux transporter periplasmic adaptor subunit [Nocardioides agariphilus]